MISLVCLVYEFSRLKTVNFLHEDIRNNQFVPWIAAGFLEIVFNHTNSSSSVMCQIYYQVLVIHQNNALETA